MKTGTIYFVAAGLLFTPVVLLKAFAQPVAARPECVCRCESTSISHPEPAGNDEGWKAVMAMLGIITACGSCVGAFVLSATRFDRIVGAWRRAEIAKLWWWRFAKWFGANAVAGAVLFALAMLTGWR